MTPKTKQFHMACIFSFFFQNFFVLCFFSFLGVTEENNEYNSNNCDFQVGDLVVVHEQTIGSIFAIKKGWIIVKLQWKTIEFKILLIENIILAKNWAKKIYKKQHTK